MTESFASDVGGAAADQRPASLRILVVDDDRTLREGCANILQLDGHTVVSFGRGDQAIEAAQRQHFDIALVDLYMTPVSGMDVLQAIVAADRATLVVVMTGNPTVASSLEALRAGAWDYLPKPFSASHLQVLVGRAAHATRGTRETRELRPQATAVHGGEAMPLLGESPAFRRAVDLAQKVANTDASVMIFGESGTGKELIAQYIHRNSRRAGKKLIPVNCAALPAPLLESEMFGHRKGAFTGADRDKPGIFETANGGTLFLDELTEMSMPLQSKLLRVLQDGVVRRVGSEKQDAVVDVRMISAMNRDPQESTKSGILREDLYYRLCVVPIKLPPLRKRVEDIALLANHFLSYYWTRHRKQGAPPPYITADGMAFLQTRQWRGNVRELQNVLEHVVVISEPGQAIEPDHIPVYEDDSAAPASGGDVGVPATLMNDAFHSAKDKLVSHFEKEYLARLTARSAGNMSKAARLAGIDRTTLYRLMEKHGFRRDVLTGVE